MRADVFIVHTCRAVLSVHIYRDANNDTKSPERPLHGLLRAANAALLLYPKPVLVERFTFVPDLSSHATDSSMVASLVRNRVSHHVGTLQSLQRSRLLAIGLPIVS